MSVNKRNERKIIDLFKNSHILIFYLISFSIFSQQEPQYSQHMYNTQIINPAYAGSRGYLSLDLLSRTQWLNLEGAPRTTSFSVDTPIGNSERMGIGLSLTRDELGPSINNRINIASAIVIKYKIPSDILEVVLSISPRKIDRPFIKISHNAKTLGSHSHLVTPLKCSVKGIMNNSVIKITTSIKIRIQIANSVKTMKSSPVFLFVNA